MCAALGEMAWGHGCLDGGGALGWPVVVGKCRIFLFDTRLLMPVCILWLNVCLSLLNKVSFLLLLFFIEMYDLPLSNLNLSIPTYPNSNGRQQWFLETLPQHNSSSLSDSLNKIKQLFLQVHLVIMSHVLNLDLKSTRMVLSEEGEGVERFRAGWVDRAIAA
jgi:hypothetical protein